MTETLWPGGPSVHPAAAVFPLMEGAEFEEFVADIKTNGLQQPIWLMPDGSVLDGRNRWLACRKANVEPRFDTYDGDTPIQFVVSLNLKRRHLDEGQRAWVAQKIANLPRGGDRKSDQTANLQSDAVDVLDGADAALLKDSIPTCFRPEILQRIPACRDALLNLENLLKQGSADVASSQHVA